MILFVSKAMIPELHNIDEEDYWISWSKLTVDEDCWCIGLRVKSDLEEIDANYELKAFGVQAYQLGSRQDGDLFLLDRSHPIMLQHCDTISELYCWVDDANRYRLLSLVLEAHHKVVADWIDPFEIINKVAAGGWSYGQLAKGPTSIIKAYAEAIQSTALRWNVLANGPQKDWDGSMFHERDADVVGICFGSSYIICKHYELANKALKGTPLRGAH